MPENTKKERGLEWACRILLTVHLVLTLSGYTTYLQAKWQLSSPIIPKSTILEVTEPALYTCLCIGLLFIVSSWFYFFRKKQVVIALSSISILGYELLLFYFASR